MKNLKKILIALAVVALLVSSFALIVGAEGEYSGELKKLYNNYAAVDSTASATAQAAALGTAYNYLLGNTFDPEATYEVTVGEGDDAEKITYTYADIVALMDAASVSVGELLYANAEAATTADARMSATSALLTHIAACPATEGTAGYAELVAKAAAKNSAVVAEQYELAAAAETSAGAQKILVALSEHTAKYPLDATADAALIASIQTLACEIAAELYTAWTDIPTEHVDAGAEPDGKCDVCAGAMDSSTSAHYFKRYNDIYSAKYFIAKVGLLVNGSAVAGLTGENKTAVDNVINASKIMDAERTAKQIALDEQAAFSEYDFGKPYLVVDCESTLMSNHNGNADCYASAATDVFGNRYHNFHYGSPSVHLYTEPQVGTKNAYQLGMVMDWDMIFDSNFAGTEFVCREPSVGMVTIMTITSSSRDGVFTIKNNTSNNTNFKVEPVSVTGVMAPNVWTHFTLTYDDVTRTGKLYVNYEYVCDIGYSSIYKFVGLRLGRNIADQEIGYDNFAAMNGTQYRIWDKFSSMTSAEQFNYYVNYFINDENPSLSRNAAYNKAKLLYSSVKSDDACEAAVALYNNCNYDEEIKKPAMKENLGILSGMVDELLAMQINSDTTAAVNGAIDDINTFVSVNGELINKGDTTEGGYQSLMIKVNTVKADLVKVENVTAFVSALSKFERATTLASMSKYAEAAQAVYVLAAYDVPENVAFVANDPLVLSFEASINGEDVLPDDEAYITLFEYYETVAEKIAFRSLYENAKRIISCMNFVTSMEGYEATPEFWAANAEYISCYVNIARDVIISGNYDTTVEGIDEAVATFRALDVSFYELLQQQHVAFLEEQLAKYVATEIYIDKVGVCSVVAQYLAENDIAVYNTGMTDEVAAAVADEIAALEALIIKYNVYNDELVAQKDDYDAVLAQNTQYFVNTVNHMDTVLTYAELKPMFDKATGYYYSIDVDSEEAAAAADKYIAYREQLEAWETNGAIFIGYVDGLAAAKALSGFEREDAIYEVLVNCIDYVDLVDESVKGVKNAMTAYETALAEYNAELEIVNSDINESAKITCAVRTRSISNIVLAIVSKIFED